MVREATEAHSSHASRPSSPTLRSGGENLKLTDGCQAGPCLPRPHQRNPWLPSPGAICKERLPTSLHCFHKPKPTHGRALPATWSHRVLAFSGLCPGAPALPTPHPGMPGCSGGTTRRNGQGAGFWFFSPGNPAWSSCPFPWAPGQWAGTTDRLSVRGRKRRNDSCSWGPRLRVECGVQTHRHTHTHRHTSQCRERPIKQARLLQPRRATHLPERPRSEGGRGAHLVLEAAPAPRRADCTPQPGSARVRERRAG